MQAGIENKDWTAIEKILFRFFFIYVLLFINSFSFEHSIVPDAGKFTSPFFELLVSWTAKNLFHFRQPYTIQLVSDSVGMYVNAFNLFFISVFVSGVWSWFDRQRKNYDFLFYWFTVAVRYYLALQLFEYGFNKIFKWQFYLPEPNTLFTTVGETPRDLLYWSTMGVSRPYTVCMGVAEALAAFLLLFRRTMLAGALFSFGIMINVLLVNLCYDISVKLYSCFLLLLCLILLVPHSKRLFNFFTGKKSDADNFWKPVYNSPLQKKIYIVAKALVIFIILTDTSYRYFSSGNLDDDKAPRPFLHGAYNVEVFVKNNDTLPPLLTDKIRWKRFFVHRDGYFIIQDMKDEMHDYTLDYDFRNNKLLIDSLRVALDYRLANDSVLILSGRIKEDTISVTAKKIDLEKLWLLKNEFSWTLHAEN